MAKPTTEHENNNNNKEFYFKKKRGDFSVKRKNKQNKHKQFIVNYLQNHQFPFPTTTTPMRCDEPTTKKRDHRSNLFVFYSKYSTHFFCFYGGICSAGCSLFG